MDTYTFSEDCYSDLYKDVYGFRPRNTLFHDLSDDLKQEIWDDLCKQLEINIDEEAIRESVSVSEFQKLLAKSIELGAKDESEALWWLIKHENFCSSQDSEHFVWEHGILFTDYGKEIVNKINTLYFGG